MIKTIILMLLAIVSLSSANEIYYKDGKLVTLQNLHLSRSVNNSYVNFYKNEHGQKIGITDEILIQCKEGVSCLKLFNKMSITNYSKLTDKIFIVKVEDYDNIFSLSRELYESGEVEFAHPNFIQEKKRR
jgi:hypothetical protein